MAVQRYSAASIREQITSVLRVWGMSDEHLAITADVMVETDLWGVDSHGIQMLAMYEMLKCEGRLNVHANIKVVDETAVMARIDGDAGLGHPVAHKGMHMAVDKALATGIGAVTAFNSHHFGAAGVYSKIASDRGCIGITTSTARTIAVVPTFGVEPVLGTNPIAFAAPANSHRPFILDMATSAVAVNKVKVYALHDQPLAEGWVVDGSGAAITDAHDAVRVITEDDVGGLNPTGGTRALGSHKGYGLGVIAQILAGALTGACFAPIRKRNATPTQPDDLGHFFLAIDPKRFVPDGDFGAAMDEILDVLRATKPANAEQPVLIPGDPEFASREQRSRDGVPLPATLTSQIKGIAERAGVPFLLD
jgi:LDH2 family malate/lactate/ureidoglycolate dehydrogenase